MLVTLLMDSLGTLSVPQIVSDTYDKFCEKQWNETFI